MRQGLGGDEREDHQRRQGPAHLPAGGAERILPAACPPVPAPGLQRQHARQGVGHGGPRPRGARGARRAGLRLQQAAMVVHAQRHQHQHRRLPCHQMRGHQP